MDIEATDFDTIRVAIAHHLAKGIDPHLSLRQVATITGWKLGNIRRYVYESKSLPVEHIGPMTLKRVRMRYSAVWNVFRPDGCPDPTKSAALGYRPL
jgi:hypothetical protein